MIFYCFNCGCKLVGGSLGDGSLGFLYCESCNSIFLPEDDNQCLMEVVK